MFLFFPGSQLQDCFFCKKVYSIGICILDMIELMEERLTQLRYVSPLCKWDNYLAYQLLRRISDIISFTGTVNLCAMI